MPCCEKRARCYLSVACCRTVISWWNVCSVWHPSKQSVRAGAFDMQVMQNPELMALISAKYVSRIRSQRVLLEKWEEGAYCESKIYPAIEHIQPKSKAAAIVSVILL